MHRFSGGGAPLAPGLTPLTGVYSHPSDGLWACYRRDVPQLSYVTDHDASDAETYCVKVSSLETAVKLGYYAVRLLQALRNIPVPPP